jgi:hypothetical protein
MILLIVLGHWMTSNPVSNSGQAAAGLIFYVDVSTGVLVIRCPQTTRSIHLVSMAVDLIMNSTRWSLSITVSALATIRGIGWRVGSSNPLMISSSIGGQ